MYQNKKKKTVNHMYALSSSTLNGAIIPLSVVV